MLEKRKEGRKEGSEIHSNDKDAFSITLARITEDLITTENRKRNNTLQKMAFQILGW